MTVEQLILLLQTCDSDAEVVFDAATEGIIISVDYVIDEENGQVTLS